MPIARSASELAGDVRSGLISPTEVASAYIERVERFNGLLGAFLWFDPDAALAEARQVESRLARGEDLPLAGVPIAVKDNISTRGIPTTCASRILEGYVPPYDATVVERLRLAGAIVFGKTNLDEFAMGGSTETSAFGPSRNPWDLERSPGGSSGGSAAAVAGLLSPAALGSDTGGSIRMPAALCGIVGFKPTYGRCSRYGLVAFGSSLDQIGPMALTVEDAGRIAAAITGHDPRDGTSLDAPPIQPAFERASLRGKRLALPRELSGEALHPAVRSAFLQALDTLRAEGAEVEEVSLPSVRLAVSMYYILAPAEASSNLARFDGIRFGPREGGAGHVEAVERTRGRLFGHEVKTRIMIGTYVLSAGYYEAYYTKAQQARAILREEFRRVLQRCDAVVSPSVPVPAFRIGELSGDPVALKMLDLCTIPANMGGFCAISIPCGLAEGLPVGLQLLGPPMGDEALLETAHAAERALPPIGLPPLN
ncbi:MAG: Asp-tRNA(Asn)/Glu-tRNA(Gln) amidotransferase subunit GatA [Fimbriimonadales bacterium]|nr:Asp-tRNA(Asn)/Glu-tRNA(Gln) amidotransferase subunit GatA [Fimbriimonadales bacterium]